MNRKGTARCFAVVAGAYGLDASQATLESWHLLLHDLDADAAFAATTELCRRDSPFAPRPGEIRALVARAQGDDAPSVEAAAGHYLAGNWDIHPLVAVAAAKVHWDRQMEPDKALWQFRALYSAAAAEETTRHARAAVKPGDPRPVAELLPTGANDDDGQVLDVRGDRP